MSVRAATREDAEALASLAGELGYPSTGDEMLQRFDALPESETVFVAAEPDVMAWVQVGLTYSLESGAFAEIRGLVVQEEQRSRGIGGLLVHAAKQWARARGMSRMRVRSNVIRERTHRFYERIGYTVKKSQKAFEKSLN